MKWTTNAPTQLGYYWLADGESEEPELVRVVREGCHYEGGLEIVRMGSDVHDSISLGHYVEETGCSMSWFGPIDLSPPAGWKTAA